jgi:hypothetical protein
LELAVELWVLGEILLAALVLQVSVQLLEPLRMWQKWVER